MKFINKLSITVLSALAITATAQAEELSRGGLFVEPMITYQSGDMDVTYPGITATSKEETKGFGLGARLGFHVYESVFIGADGRYSKPKYDSSALGGDADADAYNLGLTVGAQTPVAGLRVWGTYLLGGELNPAEINGADIKWKDLKGYRVGVGLYVGVVSINAEYQDAKYDSLTVEKAGPISGNTDSIKGDDKSYILSVSFPISI